MKITSRKPVSRRAAALVRQPRKNQLARHKDAGTGFQHLDDTSSSGPLGYSVAVALMAIRPLLRTLREDPDLLTAVLLESVTPLLEQLENRLHYCQACQKCQTLAPKHHGILQ